VVGERVFLGLAAAVPRALLSGVCFSRGLQAEQLSERAARLTHHAS
jgi:hypothetical protein